MLLDAGAVEYTEGGHEAVLVEVFDLRRREDFGARINGRLERQVAVEIAGIRRRFGGFAVWWHALIPNEHGVAQETV